MKKRTFTILIFFFALSQTLLAQTEKSNFLIGGTASYTINRYDFGSNRLVNISPSIGYFFANKWVAGVNLPFTYQKSDTRAYTTPVQIYSFSSGVFLKRYLALSNRWQWFGQAAYNYQWYRNNLNDVFGSSGNPVDFNQNSWEASLGLGVTYFFNQNIGLEGLLKYNYRNQGSLLATEPQSNVNFNIGLQIYLGRKKQESGEETSTAFEAPTQKGNMVLGGSGLFNFNKYSNDLFLQPRFGYFLANNFLVGGGIGVGVFWGRSEFQVANNVTSATSDASFATNLFARYYFLPYRFKLFTEVGFDYGKAWTQYRNTMDSHLRGLNLGVGGTYFISPKVAVEGSVNYQRIFQQRGFQSNNPLDFRIGFQVYFNRK